MGITVRTLPTTNLRCDAEIRQVFVQTFNNNLTRSKNETEHPKNDPSVRTNVAPFSSSGLPLPWPLAGNAAVSLPTRFFPTLPFAANGPFLKQYCN